MAFDYNPYEFLPKLPSFTLTSESVTDGKPLSNDQVSGIMGAGGSDVSPQLSWSGFPEDDAQLRGDDVRPRRADRIGFLALGRRQPARHRHRSARRARGRQSGLPGDALILANDAGLKRFIGAAPPAGHGAHRYIIAVHAVGVEKLDLPAEATPAYLGFNLFGNAIARALIHGTYERRVAPTTDRARPSPPRRPGRRNRRRAGGGQGRRECAWPTGRRRR